MKRTFAVILAFAFCTLVIAAGNASAAVSSVDPPHFGATAGGVDTLNTCGTCHTTHNTLAPGAENYNNLCQTCHRSGDAAAGRKPITLADAADPFQNHSTHGLVKLYQTSHRWSGTLDVPAAGAKSPIQPGMTTANLRKTVGANLACSRCHNQHNQVVLPGGALDKNFYRIANDKDQMCMDCHRTRDVKSHTAGSHPVNVAYPATANFNNPPLNANPANPSSAVKLNNGNVNCSTCHGVHFTDSRSSTVDGGTNFANISTGDGYLLRTDFKGKRVATGLADDLNICTNCHAGKTNHNYKNQNVQCVDCHGAHVEFDPNDPNNTKGTNVFLIRRNVTKQGQASQIMFRYTGNKREYVNNTNTGVCQGCHDVPPPGGIYPAQHDSSNPGVCNNCHFHSNQHGSFAGACNNCHGHPPKLNTIGVDGLAKDSNGNGTGASTSAGAHVTHVTGRGMDCSTCHNGYANRPMPNKIIDIGFAANGVNVPGFLNSNSNGTYINTNTLTSGYTWNGSVATTGTNQSCANVYCHGATLTGGTHTQPSWTGTNQAGCGTCHGVYLDTAPVTGNHGVHTNLKSCDYCHGAHNNNNHVNGAVEWDFRSSDASATYKTPNGLPATFGATKTLAPSAVYGSCTNKCHGSQSSPTWGGSMYSTTEQCAKCHSSIAGVTASGQFYSTSYPTQVLSNTDSKVGAHAAHIKGTYALTVAITCDGCHTSVAAVNDFGHMNGTTDIPWGALATKNGAISPSYDPATGTCSNVYCHGNGMPNGDTSGSNRSPSWKSPFMSSDVKVTCGSCHGFPPVGHGYTSQAASIPELALECSSCHPYVNVNATVFADLFLIDPNTGMKSHIDTIVQVNNKCNGCHGYPPARKGFSAGAGNWQYAKVENYTGAGGAHTVAGHVSPNADVIQGWANCNKCHNPADHVMSPKVFEPSNNIKVNINSRDRFSNGRAPMYTSNKQDGNAHVPGTCSNVACHFQKTPKW